ncbi:putative trans-sialidase, Group VIII [Trypanosoma cruzi]|uniref:Trans-sialidase, putative n=2 Tax=Trypanosoma cruzi TaxID=5693 RepID=Q4DM65_TRYCC|nr:trans-sialidase, putative [Trypanosoma cruzi]EAN93628.1 trans-sialidase, putative [Trypanosoma cruzi]PWV19060.1 putative trans-sialidase, Group VIII [Trypanosoma cruzi]|eukprot:XP_815479.1 trans-sialidase [Trypanosoma cruzi strain CL Brener]
MHSRIAAVKAPRTHNRRCVTGSSGRRREGRESEPKRPNMSRRVFTSAVLLLLFVMTCCGSGGAASAGGSNVKKAVDALSGIGWEKLDKWEEIANAGGKYGSIRGPSLVEVQGHVFAIAEVHCKDGGECSKFSFTGIASKYLGLNVDAGPTEISTTNASIFGADLLKEGSEGINTRNGITRPTTVVLEESVYVLLGNYSHTRPQVGGTNERGLLLVKGTLTEENGKKQIRWNETHVMKPEPKGYSHSLSELIGGGGSGAVLRDGTLVFPMQAKDKDGTSFLLSMRFSNSRKKWELSYMTGKGCRDPTLVKWEEYEYGEELFMMAHCAGGYYDVYRSTSDGVNWNGHFQPITRVWGNSHNRKGYGVQSGFTTAIIEGKEVMLITAPVYAKEDNEGGKGRLHLWVTDKARVYDVGPVSREDEDAAASSLLLKGKDNKELISLYENKKSDGSYNLVAVRLTEKLERIKEVVKTWQNLDSALQSCIYPAGYDSVSTRGMCVNRVPTERLVGFLSGNSTQTEWRDEYLGVNATVTNGEPRVPNGLTFKGPGAGAEWPVGKLGQTVPYYFANTEFTLVATVSIHEVPQSGSIPLMGVRMNDTKSTVLFGLSYTHEKKWLAIAEDPATSKLVDGWEPNKTYQVVLKMNSNSWTVLVDREEIHNTNYNDHLFDFHRISHFYIGWDSKNQSATGGHVTVTNVMLYNEELFGDDLYELHASKVTVPSLGDEKQSTGPVAGTDVSVAFESNSEESATSNEELTGDDTHEQRGKSVHILVPAASPSTDAAGSSVPEPATATESAGNSRSEDNAQLSEGETSQQATLNEDNESMQRDSELQTQELQSEESTEATDFEGSAESYGTEQPEEEGGTNGRSGGSVSSGAASSDMDTVATPVNGEHQVQQITEPSAENDDVRSTGTVTTGAEESFSLEAGDGNSERTMNSDGSLTPSKSDAEPTSAEDTDNISRTEGEESSSEDVKEVPQTVDTAPGNTNTTPGETMIPSESNATTPSDTDVLLEHGKFGDLLAMGEFAENTVHVCVSRVSLLLLLGLWGTAALC